jgi:hypothetical protein
MSCAELAHRLRLLDQAIRVQPAWLWLQRATHAAPRKPGSPGRKLDIWQLFIYVEHIVRILPFQ